MTSNANNHKYKSGVIEQSTRIYEKALHEELTRDRELNLIFPCMNLKKSATWLDLLGLLPIIPTSKHSNKLYNVLKSRIISLYSKTVLGLFNPRTVLSTV